MNELGELLNTLATCVEFPNVFEHRNWRGVTYPTHANVANIIVANIREFSEMLAEARKRCLSLGMEETRETRETLAYAILEWEGYTDEWLETLRMDDGEAVTGHDELAWECVRESCNRIAEGCLIPWRRLAAMWIAAGELKPCKEPPKQTGDPEQWITLTATARGFGWEVGKHQRPNASKVSRLIAEEKLRDNGEVGKLRRVSKASIVTYCEMSGEAWNDVADL